MEKKYADIINEGQKAGKTVKEINADLKAAGANFHLNPDGGVAGWTEQEMAEGFQPGEPAKDVQRKLDMGRKMEFAGTKQVQRVNGSVYEVSYDEDGYAMSAVRIRG